MAVTTYGRRETLVNNWTSNLNGSIINTDMTIVVDDATGLPTENWFRIKINNEIIICEGRTTNTLDVFQRGAEGTTAASHSDGDAVSCLLTAGGMKKLLLEHGGSPFSQESTVVAAPLCRTMDEDQNILTVSNFTWVNQGSATATDSNGGILMTSPNEASHNLRMLVRSVPATPFNIRTRLWLGPGTITPGANSAHAGLVLRQSSTGKLVTLSVRYGSGTQMWRWTNATTFSAVVDTNCGYNDDVIWLHLEDDGTNIKGYFSHDGNGQSRNTSTWWQESRTAFLLTTGADQVGIYINSGAGLSGQQFTFEQVILEEE